MYWVPITEYMYSKFTNSIGIQVRSRAPVCYCGWNKIPADIKKTLREGLTVHFDVEIEHPKIVNFVTNKMRLAYTQFKWKLHDHYRKCGTPAQGRAILPPPDLWGMRPREEWQWLCDKLYTNPKYIWQHGGKAVIMEIMLCCIRVADRVIFPLCHRCEANRAVWSAFFASMCLFEYKCLVEFHDIISGCTLSAYCNQGFRLNVPPLYSTVSLIKA